MTYRSALAISDTAFNAISVTGAGFGLPLAGSSVALMEGATTTVISSTDRRVLGWTESQVVVKVPPSLKADAIRVTVGGVTTGPVPIHYYVHDWFETDLPRDPGRNGSPLAIAVDRKSRLWLTEEFGFYGLKMIDLRTGALTQYESPFPAAGENVFCGSGGVNGSTGATGGEDVLVDERGRVWTTEGGNVFCRDPTGPNHSRILMFDPRRPVGEANPRVFNVPGNKNDVIGVAWDQRRRRLWFTETAGALPAGLGSFDPLLGNRSTDNRTDCPWPGTCGFETTGLSCDARCTNAAARSCSTANDCQFCQQDGTCNDPPGRECTTDADCHGSCRIEPGAVLGSCSNLPCRFCISDAQCLVDRTIGCGLCSNSSGRACETVHDCALAERVCPWPDSDPRTCLAEHREPDRHSAQPAHVVVDRKGILWYTNYFTGNDIRRFDPDSGQFISFNIPRPPATDPMTVFGAWPWQILANREGDIFFTGYASGQIGRISASKLQEPSVDCDGLPAGTDFCGDPLPGASPCIEIKTLPGPPQVVHSITLDRVGNVWFGAAGVFDDPGLPSSLGYVNQDLTEIMLLPPLSIFPFVSHGSDCAAAGEFVTFSGAGVAYDRRSHAILVADYCRKRVVRLRPEGGG